MNERDRRRNRGTVTRKLIDILSQQKQLAVVDLSVLKFDSPEDYLSYQKSLALKP